MRPPHRRRRPRRPPRARYFVGCEGESEQGYAALLQRLADQAGLWIHLDALVLQPGGGDPCAIIELAADRARRRERQHGRAYAHRIVLLDADKRGLQPDRDARGLNAAAAAGLTLIWQEPCHEALLLRHLEQCSQLRPPLSADALQQLTNRWPGYQKPMSAAKLAERIDTHALGRISQVEPGLGAFLALLNLV